MDAPKKCERCEDEGAVAKAPVRTAYYNDPQPQPWLCPPCTEEWNAYWDERWAEYYGSLL